MKILLSTAVLLAALGSVAYAQDINADRAAVMRANGAAVGALRPLTSAFAAAAALECNIPGQYKATSCKATCCCDVT